MPDVNVDVKPDEEQNPKPEGEGTGTSESESSSGQNPEDEQKIPRSRLNEVIGRAKTAEGKVELLEKELSLRSDQIAITPTSEEQWGKLEDKYGMSRAELEPLLKISGDLVKVTTQDLRDEVRKLRSDNQLSGLSKKPNWDIVGDEVTKRLSELSPTERAKPGIENEIYFQVKGERTEEIIKQRQAGASEETAEINASGGVSPTTTPAMPKVKVNLTPQEVGVANKMGIPLEKYAANKAKIAKEREHPRG